MAEDPKLTEFRDRNTALSKENDGLKKEVDDLKKKYEGIEPDQARAAIAKVSEFEKAKPAERITALETELATERAAHANTRKEADTSLIESKISDAFLKAGGRPEARKFIVAESAGQFVVEKGELRGTKHSPDKPGELMTLSEWMTLQTRAHPYTFFASVGGGADPKRGGGGTSGKVLRNPSPTDLGRYAKEIASGEMRVQYD